MKYRVGDRFRYFSIVGRYKKSIDDVHYTLECICDCGNSFSFNTKHVSLRILRPCHSNKKCGLWSEINSKEAEWPDNSRKRMSDFHAAIGGLKDLDKTCKTCNKKKYKGLFHQDMQQTCLDCIGDMSVQEFKDRQEKRWRDKKKGKMIAIIGSAKDKDGYIYIMYSVSLDLYKVGVSNEPYGRVYQVRGEYGISDLKLLCIGNPIGRSFKSESYIHHKILRYKIKHIKPNGGTSNELFSCDLSTVTNVFLSACQDYEWLDDETKDLVLC